MFAGHEPLLNISQFQVIHWQHVLLLLLLKKGISNKLLAAPGEACSVSREEAVSNADCTPPGRHWEALPTQAGHSRHVFLLPFSHLYRTARTHHTRSLTLTRAPSASLTNTEKPKSSSMHDTAPRVVCFKPHSLHLPKLLVRKRSLFEHCFPMSPHKQTSHTLLQHLLRDHQHRGHAGPIPKTHRQVTACSVLHHNCWARRAQYEPSYHIQSVIRSPHSPTLVISVFWFFFLLKSLKTSVLCSRKDRHMIEKLF